MSHITNRLQVFLVVPLPTSITKPYPQINVLFHLCNNVLISATVTKKVTCLTQIPQHSYWPNLKHTPSLYKLNIFLWLQAIIHDNFLNLSEKLFDMNSTIHLQFKISNLIDEILDNWSHEKYRITIESFRRTSDCLVLIKIGLWNEPNHFLKCAVSIKPSSRKSYSWLENLLLSLLNLWKAYFLLVLHHTTFFHLNLTQVSTILLPHLFQLIDLLQCSIYR